MRLITACLLGISVLATPAFAEPILDIQTMRNGDGTYSHWISIDPNTGLDEVAFINTTIMAGEGQKLHQFLRRDTFGSVDLQTLQGTANALDPTYPIERDTVFADGSWPGIVDIVLTPATAGLDFVPAPAPQPSPNGITQMQVQAASFTGGFGGPIPSGQFTPIWHAVTWGDKLWVSGEIQTDSQPHGTFSAHVPEPSSALLAGLALSLLGVVRRRRK